MILVKMERLGETLVGQRFFVVPPQINGCILRDANVRPVTPGAAFLLKMQENFVKLLLLLIESQWGRIQAKL